MDEPGEEAEARQVSGAEAECLAVAVFALGGDAAVGRRGVAQALVALARAARVEGPVEDEGAVGEEVGEVEARQSARLGRLLVVQAGSAALVEDDVPGRAVAMLGDEGQGAER